MFVARRAAGCATAVVARARLRTAKRNFIAVSGSAEASALLQFLLGGAAEDQCEREEQQAAEDHPRRAFVQERNEARHRAVRFLNDIASEEHRVEDPGERAA